MKNIEKWLDFKHIRTRLTVVILSLVAVQQIASLVPLKISINQHSFKIAENQLAVGERVYENLIQQNSSAYQQSAKVLASDYAFREAVATNDIGTIQSALLSYQERIHAEVAYYVSDDGSTLAHTATTKEAEQKINLDRVREQYTAGKLRFDIIDGKPFQLISVPVKAPIVIGWIVFGFQLDQSVANQIKQLTNLDVTFVQKTNSNDWKIVGGTLSADGARELIDSMSPMVSEHDTIHQKTIENDSFHIKLRKLYEDKTGEQLFVVLQESVTKYVQELNTLFLTLLVLTLAGISLLAAVIWLTTKKMVKPISELTENVTEMTKGNYSQELTINRRDELGQLGKLFNEMREAIQERTNRIHRLAFHDELTGLYNSLSFMQGVNSAIHSHAPLNKEFAIVVLNVNRFKPINSLLGRDFGDDLLRHVGQVLKENIFSPSDIVARLDADEFAVLLQHSGEQKASAFVANVLKIFHEPVFVQDQPIDVRTGIGVAVYPSHGLDEESLLNHAETAQLESKSRKIDFIVYDQSLEVDESENLTMITDLKEAIAKNQLLLFIQPKIDIATREAIGGEALIRWKHPVKGMVFPDQFIPFAEQTGVISDITNWMLVRACQVLHEYQQRGIKISIAVNLSTRDLNNFQLPHQLSLLLSKYQLDAKYLKLEITEGSLMQDPERAQAVVRKLADMGFHLAIDDFGTGYSSLAYLRQLPVQELKIDRSFVMFMDKNSGDASIVKSTIDLAHNLGLRVVAEGIENLDVLTHLGLLGCDEGQGYFIGKPLSERDFSSWLDNWRDHQGAKISISNSLPIYRSQIGEKQAHFAHNKLN